LSSPTSPADHTDPTDTRRGRAWIDQAAGVRIGYALRYRNDVVSLTTMEARVKTSFARAPQAAEVSDDCE
jgi:hypothetical protein